MKRREAVGAMALAALGAAFKWTPAEARRVAGLVREGATPFAPSLFTPHEWETVGLLVDLIIPRDERSRGASEAGLPESKGFVMTRRPDGQAALRGGRAWL